MEQLEKDKVDLELAYKDEELSKIKQETFRNIVKTKIEKFAVKQLTHLKLIHSKSEKLEFNGLKPADYISSKNLTVEEGRTLFQLRTRMIDVKGNFSSAHTHNMWCKLCLLFTETQQHLLECPELRMGTKHLIDFKTVDHEMAFGSLKNQEKIAKVYKILIEARKDLLDK